MECIIIFFFLLMCFSACKIGAIAAFIVGSLIIIGAITFIVISFKNANIGFLVTGIILIMIGIVVLFVGKTSYNEHKYPITTTETYTYVTVTHADKTDYTNIISFDGDENGYITVNNNTYSKLQVGDRIVIKVIKDIKNGKIINKHYYYEREKE